MAQEITKEEYLKEARENLLGKPFGLAQSLGYHVVTEKPSQLFVRVSILIEVKEGIISKVIELV